MSASSDHGRADAEAAAQALSGDDIHSGSSVLPPLSGIVELIVLTGLIVIVDAALPDVDLADIQPNPFWLPVLLLSLQYGTVSGILAAATALLVTLISGLPEPGVGENYFNYAMRVFTQPILWFVVALLLGQFRMRQIQAKRGLSAMVVDLEKQRAALAGYANGLRRRCDMLERDRAGSSEAGSVALLATLAQLGSGPTASGATSTEAGDPLAADFTHALAATFPGASASVLSLTPAGLVPVVATASTAPARTAIDTAHPFFRAITEGRALSVLQRGDEQRLAGNGLAAVPIRDAAGGIIGALRLDNADPSCLGPATLPALTVLAAALSARLAPTDTGSVTPPHTVTTPAAGIAPPQPEQSGSGHLRRKLQTLSWLKQRRAGAQTAEEPSPPANDALPPQRSKAPN